MTSQWQLFWARKFWPFFWTQFLGAFNDNVFKNALAIMVAYKSLSLGGLSAEQIVPLCAGLFILPFFLFSASAGQLADKFSKTVLIRWVKLLEIVIMLGAVLGFFLESLPLLLVVLFFMGLQSTMFGPAKYSILPDLLESRELVGGNALVEMGTFLAILLGTIAGGLLIAAGDTGQNILCISLVVVAALGFQSSRSMQKTTPGNPSLMFSFNPITPALQTFAITRKNKPVLWSVVGISWFWFFGASFLTLLPNYAKQVLFADELVLTLLLSLFCVGISIGSLLCERLSRGRLELGIVPIGSLGMTIFALDLFFVGIPQVFLIPEATDTLRGPGQFLSQLAGTRISLDFVLIAIFGGLFTVPLYTMIQQRTETKIRSRVIAGNNILNALFMVISAAMLMGLSALEVSIPETFLVLAGLNVLMAFFVYSKVPEFVRRFLVIVRIHKEMG